MGKVGRAISIDDSVWNKARVLYPHQLSQKIEDYLRVLIYSHNKDITSLNIELEKLDLEAKEKEFIDLKADIEHKRVLINEYQEQQEQKRKEELEEQKKKIEEEVICTKCGTNRDSKLFNLYDQKLCKICFLSYDHTSIRKDQR